MADLARACGFALLVSACFVDEGLPVGPGPLTADPSTTSTTSTTTGVTTDVTSTTTPATTTVSVTTTTTTDATATTAPPVCAQAGEPCGDGCCGCLACVAGVCQPSDDACGACRTCTATGACDPTPDIPCPVDNDACTTQLWGIDGKYCHAYAPATGQCDAEGTCVSSGCTEQGESIASCLSPKCVDASACTEGDPIDALGQLCVQQGTTAACTTTCTDSAIGSNLSLRQCGPGGACITLDSKNCGGYKCDGESTCKTTCMSDTDCAFSFACLAGDCVAL